MKTIEYNVIAPNRDDLENHIFHWYPGIPKIVHYQDKVIVEHGTGKEAMAIFNKYFGNGITRLEKKCPKGNKETNQRSDLKSGSRTEGSRYVSLYDQWQCEDRNTQERNPLQEIQ